MRQKARRLTAAQARKRTDPRSLRCATSEDLKELTGFIGQPRAVKAFDFGLSAQNDGYNIFVVGPHGSGRTSYTLKTVCLCI